MKTFVTSDLHLGHKNILKFNPDTRPYASVDEMNEALVENWNSVVGPSDTVYNLGDVAFMGYSKLEPLLERLNGIHILIYGNHDQVIKKNLDKVISRGLIREVHDYYELNVNRQTICMSHYSMRVWNKMHHGSIMLYGHSHGSLPGIGRSMDVGIDSSDLASNQRPFLLDDVIDYMNTKEVVTFDHHVSPTLTRKVGKNC